MQEPYRSMPPSRTDEIKIPNYTRKYVSIGIGIGVPIGAVLGISTYAIFNSDSLLLAFFCGTALLVLGLMFIDTVRIGTNWK